MKKFTIIAAALAAVGITGAAGAADYPFEAKGCVVTEATVLGKVGDVTVGTNVTRGQIDIAGGKSDRLTHDCRVLWSASKAGVEFTNRCINTDKDGDKNISVASGSPKSFQWKYIGGTGKFTGIAGGGSGEITTRYPRAEAVSVSCWQGKGMYTLPQ